MSIDIGLHIILSLVSSRPIQAMRLDRNEKLVLLQVAHKYCMDEIEEDILSSMQDAKTTSELVLLMAASKLAGSDTAYKDALKRLTVNKPDLTPEQARLIGVEALYDIFTTSPSIPAAQSVQCYGCHSNPLRCYNCGRNQPQP